MSLRRSEITTHRGDTRTFVLYLVDSLRDWIQKILLTALLVWFLRFLMHHSNKILDYNPSDPVHNWRSSTERGDFLTR